MKDIVVIAPLAVRHKSGTCLARPSIRRRRHFGNSFGQFEPPVAIMEYVGGRIEQSDA
jgi:hypothetical protein